MNSGTAPSSGAGAQGDGDSGSFLVSWDHQDPRVFYPGRFDEFKPVSLVERGLSGFANNGVLGEDAVDIALVEADRRWKGCFCTLTGNQQVR